MKSIKISMFLLIILLLNNKIIQSQNCNHSSRYRIPTNNDGIPSSFLFLVIDKSNPVYSIFPINESWRNGLSRNFDEGNDCFDFKNNPTQSGCNPDLNEGNNNLRRYLQYSNTNEDSLQIRLRVYEPKKLFGLPDDCNNRAAIIFIHGGGLTPLNTMLRTSSYNDDVCSFLASAGYVVFSIDYRKGWDSKGVGNYANMQSNDLKCEELFRSCYENSDSAKSISFLKSAFRNAQDLKAAHRFVHANYNQYKIDTNNIYYWGGSSGSYIAMNSHFMQDEDWQTLLNDSTLSVKNFGNPSFRHLEDRIKVKGMVLGTPSIIDTSYIKLNELIPLFLIHGNYDSIIPMTKERLLHIDTYNGSSSQSDVFNVVGTTGIFEKYNQLDSNYLIKVIEEDGHNHVIGNIQSGGCVSAKKNILEKSTEFIRDIIRNNSQSKYYCKLLNPYESYCCCVERNTINKLQFDGSNQFVRVSNGGSFNTGNNEFSLEVMIENADVQNSTMILPILVSNRNQSNNNGYALGLINDSTDSNNKKVFFSFSTSQILRSDNNIDVMDGGCHHIAITREGNIFKMYIDGELQSQTINTSVNISGLSDVYFGKARHFESISFYKGDIKFVRIWNETKSQSEIQKLMATEIFKPNNISTLRGYYKLDECSGQVVRDNSSLSRNGTLGQDNQVNSDDPVRINDEICIIEVYQNFQSKMNRGGDNSIIKSSNIESPITQFEYQVFPNPFSSKIIFRIIDKYEGASFINIYNSLGQLLISRNASNESEININTNDFPSGLYLYEIINNDRRIQQGKLIK